MVAVRILLGILVLIMVGCRRGPELPEPVAISGKITLKGKPVDAAIVAFTAISEGLPGEFRYAEATTDANGEYKMPRVYPAEYQVQVLKPESRKEPDPNHVVANPSAKSPFAAYGEESPLRAFVKKDALRFDFELSTKRK
jgi:hypothetical protein